MDVTEHLVDRDIVRGDPADPREVTQSLEEVPREEVPGEGAEERIDEEALSGYSTTVTHASISLCVEGVEKSTCDEIVGPD